MYDNLNSNNSKNRKTILIVALVVVILLTILFVYWYMFIRFRIPENADIKYKLDGTLYTEEEVIPETQSYTMVVTDLDNGRVYRKDNVIVYDTKAPIITVDNGERFFIKEFTNLYSGLTITDNYDDNPTITIIGMDVDEHAFYNVLVRAEDKYGNFREEVLECQVLSERYIDAQEKVWKERTFEGYKEFPMTRDEVEEPTYTMFTDTSLEEILEKINNKESFALFLGSQNCPWCKDAKPILENAAKETNTNILYLDVKKDECKDTCSLEDEDIRKIDNELYNKWYKTTNEEEPITVPYLIVYKEGIKESSYQCPYYDAHLKNISEKNANKLYNKYVEMLKEEETSE